MTKLFSRVLIIISIFMLVAVLVINKKHHTATIDLEKASAATIQEISFLKQGNSSSQNIDTRPKVTSVQQIPDVSQNTPYFEALRNLIEYYGVNVTFPDKTFRGNQPLTRGDFIIYLNDALVQIERLLAASTADQGNVSLLSNDLKRITQELANDSRSIEQELAQIKKRLDELERKVAKK